MDKLEYPHGLIRYTTQNQLEVKPSHVLRPRIFVYGFLLLGLATLFAVGIVQRSPLIVDVMRDKQLYRINNDGNIENSYTLRVINKDTRAHTYRIAINSAADISIQNPVDSISLSPEEVQTLAITLLAEKGKITGVADIKIIIEQTHGYPYFLQEWGKHSWDVAKRSPITARDVKLASIEATAAMDASFFGVRFDRLAPAEKRYLRAMAELGPGPHRSGDIAAELNRNVTSLAPTRNSIIAKGMIWSPSHGDTAFTVPMFDQFMKRTVPGDAWRAVG